MIRHTITLPATDNRGEGIPHVHAELRARLLDIAGGFSESPSVGYWRAPDGRIYADVSTVYTVDVDDCHTDALCELCAWLCGAARQECVYHTEQPITARLESAEVVA